jgi:heme/copper-type cytochrome/quinol oxidase subunit 2
MNKFIRDRWALLMICFGYSVLSIIQHDENTTETLVKLFIFIVVVPVLGYLLDTKFKYKFKYRKSGPLSIYKSPLIWIGIPVLIILIFTFI